MNKLLSIIIPTYNMETYLERCLTSLIVDGTDSNLMRMLEIIIVNDGSTDSSSVIAHNYETRYPGTFKVIDKENGNYGSCINVALPLVTGKYVRILDADDSFDSIVFADYIELLQKVDVDMIYSNHVTVNMAGKYGSRTKLNVTPMKKLNFRDYPQIYGKMSMHGVTYKTSIFEGLEYHQTEGIYYTDWEWVHLPMSRVESFIYYPHVLYCYLQGRPGQSVSAEVYSTCFNMHVLGINALMDVYMLCAKGGGTWNGKTINTGYMQERCILRAEDFFFNLLSQHNNPSSVSHLQEFDEMLSMKYPELYKEMESVTHANPYIPKLSLPLRYIRCLHKHGLEAAALQVRILNHWSGLSKRIARIVESCTK